LIFHELRVYNHVREKHRFIGFYETGAGVEVDFVVETKKKQAASPAHIILLEVKLATRWKNAWEKPSREIALNKKTRVERMIGIYMGKDTLHVDGYDVMPVSTFLAELWAGNIF
jgi:predicted AAA+ superfamily ATPase